MAHVMGYSENELAIAYLADRRNARSQMVQGIGSEGGAWFPTEIIVIPTDDDGGGVQLTPERAIRADHVERVSEEKRRWVTLDELEREEREDEVAAQAILDRPIPDDVDDMTVDQLATISSDSRRLFRDARSRCPRPVGTTRMGIVPSRFLLTRPQGARSQRSRRSGATASRGSTARSTGDDGPLPPEPPLGGLLRALARFVGGWRA